MVNKNQPGAKVRKEYFIRRNSIGRNTHSKSTLVGTCDGQISKITSLRFSLYSLGSRKKCKYDEISLL